MTIFDPLTLPVGPFPATTDGAQALTTFIGADGQDISEPGSTFNGIPLSAVGWHGTDPQAGPSFTHGNLWDTMTVDVTSLIPTDSTSAAATLQGGPDCLVWVPQLPAFQT